jgi:hypothetical protein
VPKLLVLVAAAALAAAFDADASIWVASDARAPQLRVDARGNAEVSWRDVRGRRHTVLIPPRGRLLPGGRLTGPDISRPLALALPMKVVVRRTPDGRLWALQRWRVQPGRPEELHLARWRGALTELTATATCCRGDGETLAGTATFAGRPVFGSSPTPEGKRIRAVVYVDCFGCPLAAGGWARAIGLFPRAPSGSFSLFVRPAWLGTRYRLTLAGPNRGTTLAPDARIIVPTARA